MKANFITTSEANNASQEATLAVEMFLMTTSDPGGLEQHRDSCQARTDNGERQSKDGDS